MAAVRSLFDAPEDEGALTERAIEARPLASKGRVDVGTAGAQRGSKPSALSVSAFVPQVLREARTGWMAEAETVREERRLDMERWHDEEDMVRARDERSMFGGGPSGVFDDYLGPEY